MKVKPINPSTAEGLTRAPRTDRVHVRRTTSGLWTVRDELDRRGGLFQDLKSALRFARREFGPAARIVAPPCLPMTASQAAC